MKKKPRHWWMIVSKTTTAYRCLMCSTKAEAKRTRSLYYGKGWKIIKVIEEQAK